MSERKKKNLIYLVITLSMITMSIIIMYTNGVFNHEEEKIIKSKNLSSQAVKKVSYGKVPTTLYLLYSHQFEKESTLLTINQSKKIEQKYTFKNPGLDVLSWTNKKEIATYSSYTKGFYLMSKKLQKKKFISYDSPVNFYDQISSGSIVGLNTDIEKNTLIMKSSKKTKKLAFKPLITKMIEYQDSIIVFSDIIDEERSVVHIIDNKTGDIVKEIEIPSHHASDMTIYDNQLVLSTEGKLTVVDLKSFKVSSFMINNQELGLDQLMVTDGKLYISYFYEGKTGIARLNQSFETEKNKLFDFPLMKSRFTKDYLYVLTQVPSKKEKVDSGAVAAFDLKLFKKVGQYMTPKLDYKVQDFLVDGGY